MPLDVQQEVPFEPYNVSQEQLGYQHGPPGQFVQQKYPPQTFAPNQPEDFHGRGRGGHYHNQRRQPEDRPKSKHALPGHEPWLLVKTKLGRRFVHNPETAESFWKIAQDLLPAVQEFDRLEQENKEKKDNARWAEEQLKAMRPQGSGANDTPINENPRNRRRRSESLQREDEEAMMAELAAAEASAETVKTIEPDAAGMQTEDAGYDSDSSYEEVEVTDSEGEEHEPAPQGAPDAEKEVEEDKPVEFDEDDIAYQLAAMGEDYGLDPGEYGNDENGDWEEGDEGLPLTEEDTTALFRDLLDDHNVNPYTPWEKLITDESSILMDERYTVLPNMRARKECWDAWTLDKMAWLKEERAKMEKQDPRIPYLAFLADKATPKLYWPEFKRKYKRDSEMTDRKLSDKDREKLYRDHINRLKLPESSRKADLQTLLKSLPLRVLNKDTSMQALPEELLTHLHYISLPPAARDRMAEAYIRTLLSAPAAEDLSGEDEAEAEGMKRRAEKERREAALRERERWFDEEKGKVRREEARARGRLMEEERELQRAMRVGREGLKGQLADGGERDD